MLSGEANRELIQTNCQASAGLVSKAILSSRRLLLFGELVFPFDSSKVFVPG